MAGDQDLEINTSYTTPADYAVNFTRLQYYISEITLTHDGGVQTKLDGHYILANGLEDSSYDLGELSIDKVEHIQFYIGVDAFNNHADPSLWPNGHPLANQQPTMHWGWAAGYRFAAIEGKTGRGLFFTYQIHALGDQHYGSVDIDVDASEDNGDVHINLVADYLRLFDNLDVSAGLIEHSDAPKAAQLLTNLKQNVFTANSSTSTRQVFDGEFSVLNNPSTDGKMTFKHDLDPAHEYHVNIFDLAGRKVSTQVVDAVGTFNVQMQNSGSYTASLVQNGVPVKSVKFIVQ